MKLKQTPIILSLLLLAGFQLNCREEGAGTNGGTDGFSNKVTDVKVMTIKPRSFTDFIEVTGTVKADIATTVSAEESGVIKAFYKDKGDWVKAGELVLELKSEVLQASFEEAQAVYLLSKATFERQANLYKDRVISEQKYLEYKYQLDRDRARYENLKARLEKTRVRSPVSGIIVNRLTEVGEFVMPSTPLFEVVKVDTVKIAAGVPERFIPYVHYGTEAHMTFDVFPDEIYTGKITYIGPRIDRQSRTFPIEIDLVNPKMKLKPEMFAHIKIRKTSLDSVVVIPRDAIIETEAGKHVFIAKGNVAVKREVTIGGDYKNQVWITNGLKFGDQLIVVGHRDLVDGERIAIHD